jgi:ABC-type amino acid transport system permease subunit
VDPDMLRVVNLGGYDFLRERFGFKVFTQVLGYGIAKGYTKHWRRNNTVFPCIIKIHGVVVSHCCGVIHGITMLNSIFKNELFGSHKIQTPIKHLKITY